MRRPACLIAFSVALPIIFPGALQAEPLRIDGQPVAWAADAWPIPLADGPLVWRAAAAEWTTALAGFTPVAAAPIEVDGVIAFAEWDAATWQARVGDPALIGFTLITHTDGALQDADVVINAEGFRLVDDADPGAFHRPTTLRHELGHVLGLGHHATNTALMHAAQEPGEIGSVDAFAIESLAAVSSCCLAMRAPEIDTLTHARITIRAVGPGDTVRGHRADGPFALTLDASGSASLPPETTHIEAWTVAGQGVIVPVPPEPAPEMPAPEMPAPEAPERGDTSGCAHRPGPRPPQSWILMALYAWRRRWAQV